MEHSQSFAKLAAAMAKAQGDFKDAERDRDNPFFSSTYSTMAAVLGACRKALTDNGIAIFQATEHVDGDPESLQVDTILTLGGTDEWIRTKLKVRVLAMKVEKADRDAGTSAVKMITAQAMGSASTYACRIALRSLVVVASEAQEDDDGNAASGNKPADGRFLDVITEVTTETKKGKGDRQFTIHRIQTGEHGELSTFEAAAADEARRYKGTGQQVEIEGRKNAKGFGWDLVAVRLPAQAQDTAQEGQGNHQQTAPAHGQAPAAAGQQAAGRAQGTPAGQAAGEFKAEVVEFDDVILETSTKGKGQQAMYGLKTEKHGWVAMRDVKVFNRLAQLKGSGFPVHFKARTRAEDQHLNLIEGIEIVPPEALPLDENKVQPGTDPGPAAAPHDPAGAGTEATNAPAAGLAPAAPATPATASAAAATLPAADSLPSAP